MKREDDTPQREAVREALTNAIIHCDLIMDAGILRVEKHDDKLCFRNPGLLKLPIETIYRGGNSKARNPRIQNMLRMIGFGENVGSGFPKIIDAWRATDWGKPQLLNKFDVDEVELILPIKTVPQEKNHTGDHTENHTENHTEKGNGLSRIQSEILRKLEENPTYSRRELSELIDMASLGGVISALSRLKELGIIKRVGPSKGGRWEIINNGTTPQEAV